MSLDGRLVVLGARENPMMTEAYGRTVYIGEFMGPHKHATDLVRGSSFHFYDHTPLPVVFEGRVASYVNISDRVTTSPQADGGGA